MLFKELIANANKTSVLTSALEALFKKRGSFSVLFRKKAVWGGAESVALSFVL